MASSNSKLLAQSWTLFALGICLIISRIVLRRITLGAFSKLQWDDWLMILVLVPFIGTILAANETSTHWDTGWGLKMRLALEYLQTTTTWLVKACLLILYRRIFPSVTERRQRLYLVWISAYCIVSYIAIQILLPIWCFPVKDYFKSTATNLQCSTYHNHSLTALVLGTTTTFAILVYPVPFIPTPRKLLLALLFVLGLFVLATGILSRYYILADPTSSTYIMWYIAESSATICFANLPFLSSLVSSASNRSVRHLSSNLSLSQWPGSTKTSPPTRYNRLNSIATTVSSPTDPPVEESWHDYGPPPSTPPRQIHTVKATDPPPELEIYWSMRRTSTKDADAESAPSMSRRPSLKDINSEQVYSPLRRLSTISLDVDTFITPLTRPATRNTDEEKGFAVSRRPSVIDMNIGSTQGSRRQSTVHDAEKIGSVIR